MALQDTIKHVQARFGDNLGNPGVVEKRPGVPPWLDHRSERVVPIGEGDWPIIEGEVGAPVGAPVPEPGASVEDFFAYYLPFHFYRNGWGTYLRAVGIFWLARIIAAPSAIDQSSLKFAFRLLIEHERLHFLAELAASRLEVVADRSSYRPYFRNPAAAEHEEALANAQSLALAKRGFPELLIKSATSWMSQQGPGYRDFSKWRGSQLPNGRRFAAQFMVGSIYSAAKSLASISNSESGAHVASSSRRISGTSSAPLWLRPTGSGSSLGPLEILFEERRRSQPPTYLVLDVPVPCLRVARPFPKCYGLQVCVHTNDHRPPHIHIHVLGRRNRETRYEWPKLRPLPGDRALSQADERRLRKYLDDLGTKIETKIQSIVWG